MSQSVRILGVAVTLVLASGAVASAQGSRGTMGVPRVVTTPPPTIHAAPPPSSRGVMSVPRYTPPAQPRPGDLPRITTYQGGGGHIRGRRVGTGATGAGILYGGSTSNGAGYAGASYGGGWSMSGGFGRRFDPGTSRRWRPGYTRDVGCGVGCFRIGHGGRTGRFFGSFAVGYPFAIPVFVPYFSYSTYESYAQPVVEPYAEPEPARAASKLIVIGAGSGGGGDALTIETVGDSVRLNWLGANRPVREVVLFVADSAQRHLATRSASPTSPMATFEIATLSAPVAFAGVTVTFADGVTTTTTVPFRGGRAR